MNKLLLLIACSLLMVTFSCGDDQPIPKPPTYLRLDLPEHQYKNYQEAACMYSFDLAEIFSIKSAKDNACNKDIDLGPLNGTAYFSSIQMDKPLSEYVNYAINKVDEHKVMATAIEDSIIIRKEDRVFGTFFELQGNVASPFQFYLTDSTQRFVSGVVYLNATPKYDSLKPSLEYLKKDLYQLVHSFKWQ